MYADDHQTYEAGKDLANVKSSLSRNAEKASMRYNMLKGNQSKYKTMAMQNKREITNSTMSIRVFEYSSMSIQGSEIESTEKLNLLGVTVDSKLNFIIILTCIKGKPKDWCPYKIEKHDTNRRQAAAV